MNELCRRLNLQHPILLAPMAGEAAKPALAAAVSKAGGLGSLGCGYMTPKAIRDAIRALRAACERAFNINLFMPLNWAAEPAKVSAYRAALAQAHADLGIDEPEIPNRFEESFDEQFAVVLEEAPPVFSFTFGMPKREQIAALKARNIMVIGTATTVAEAKALEEGGVDAIVAQGMEAGGHRGSFLAPAERSLIGTMALVPQIVSAVKLPVIAAGGIGDGRGVAAALCLGAQAAALGTSFLLAEEAGLNNAYHAALQSMAAQDTTLTRAFSGRHARGIRNAFLDRMAGHDDAIPDYPVANAMSRAMRAAAAKSGRADYLSLWAGQAASLARPEPAAAIVVRLMAEAKAALPRL
ncbi:nitronate monooxygenase [uncultured Ferrovibrio sp.]|jgi:nitronate monooxygenase|uniref:NAD(P)H-dependent flavin oxidoreductase n=1 Tax=uncultured Ferrovibrio sp. TaxID=1576913 RepID=UPI002632A246|nr:nitronate monooxygenase [uncultured Ferrovibrio sp.]